MILDIKCITLCGMVRAISIERLINSSKAKIFFFGSEKCFVVLGVIVTVFWIDKCIKKWKSFNMAFALYFVYYTLLQLWNEGLLNIPKYVRRDVNIF